MPKIEPFEKNVDVYETWCECNRAAYESELGALAALLPKSGDGLEVGVGTGRFSASLGIGTGVDPSLAMGKLASKRGIKLIIGVGENLPCKSNHFDFLILVTTICFLDDVDAALREAYRVLRSRGYILIGFIDRHSFLGKVYEERKDDDVFYSYDKAHNVDIRYIADQTGNGIIPMCIHKSNVMVPNRCLLLHIDILCVFQGC